MGEKEETWRRINTAFSVTFTGISGGDTLDFEIANSYNFEIYVLQRIE